MSEPSDDPLGQPVREGKYARVERERRFLPAGATLSKTRLSVPPLGIDVFSAPLLVRGAR